MATPTHGNALIIKRSHAGRPRIQNRPETDDLDLMRKERLRLAQRTYRNRKSLVLAAVASRAERLEKAYTNTVNSFTKFQNFANQTSQLTPDIALALGKTALEISSFAVEAKAENLMQLDAISGNLFGREESFNPQNQPDSSQYVDLASQLPKWTEFPALKSVRPSANSWHLIPTSDITPTFAQLFWLACVERGRQILSSPTTSFSDIHPSLSMQLRWMTVDDLRTITENSLAGKWIPTVHKPKPSTIAVVIPEMYRSIEGRNDVKVPRVHGDRLVFGRTRTLVQTALPGFDEEFLEGHDVQEYLELIGVLNGNADHEYVWISSNTLETLGFEFDRGQSFVRTSINLERLITKLAGSAVCIGPCPGVRRVDVDCALIDSIQIVSTG